MPIKFLKKSVLGRALANRDGLAAIEFAFIAPIMIFLYFGLAEISMLVSADRNVSHATSVTGDLATQVETLDEDEVENIFQATLAVLGTDHSESSRLSIDMTSFEVDATSGDNVVVGYASMGSDFSGPFNATNVNSTLLNTTSGLVVTRIMYNYQSPTQKFVKTPTLSETFMLKPRKSTSIPFTNSGSEIISCLLTGSGNTVGVECN